MATYNETFERIEKKYLLSAQQRRMLMPLLAEHMQADQYGTSTVTSLYLDSANSDLICRSLEKPLYKEKLRVRRYGSLPTLSGNNPVFLEIKKKYRGVVYKRRLKVTFAAAEAFLKGMPYEEACSCYPLLDAAEAQASLSFRSIQISREIASFLRLHGPLSPSMTTACERTALVMRPCSSAASLPTEEPQHGEDAQGTPPPLPLASYAAVQNDLRITFDDNIRFADFRQRRSTPAREQLLLPKGVSLMEIKLVGSMPLWLAQALSVCDIHPQSFSKYGEAFKAKQSCA